MMNIYEQYSLLLILVFSFNTAESFEYSFAHSNIQAILRFCRWNGKAFITMTTMDAEDDAVSCIADNFTVKYLFLKRPTPTYFT